MTSASALRDAENDLLEARLVERRERSLTASSYDLELLKQIHHDLFQDVYDWAGELRTVGLAKGDGESFAPPTSIGQPMGHVALRIAESDTLRDLSEDDLRNEVAYLYDFVNYAHPFREGNGRAQREFFRQLLAESGHTLDWSNTEMSVLHDACYLARTEYDLDGLRAIFAEVIASV